ncbi:MAG: hypothetical protein ACREHE_05135 [Rhizomicrobium sp.]
MPGSEQEQTGAPVGTPSTGLVDRQIAKALDDRGYFVGGRGPGDGGGSAIERLAHLEGAFSHAMEGIRHGQIMLLGLAGVGFAIVIAVLIYMVQRLDTLPNDFMRMNQTLAGAITATKQQTPQVILMQPPQQPAPPPGDAAATSAPERPH